MTVLVRSQHQSLKSIYFKMKEKYPNCEGLIDSIIWKCAETAEQVMMEAVLKKKERIVYIEQPEPFVEMVANKSNQHVCPNCKARRIKTYFAFCHCCGSKIIWDSKN